MDFTWLWLLVFQGFAYCLVFGYLLGRHRGRWDAGLVGFLHLFVGVPVAAAPVRCFLDPAYFGYQVGFIQARGGAACLLALGLLVWAVGSALVAAASPRGRWLWLLAGTDGLMALNYAASYARLWLHGEAARFTWQGGSYWLLSGFWVGVAWQLVVTIPLLFSAWWFARRFRPAVPLPVAVA